MTPPGLPYLTRQVYQAGFALHPYAVSRSRSPIGAHSSPRRVGRVRPCTHLRCPHRRSSRNALKPPPRRWHGGGGTDTLGAGKVVDAIMATALTSLGSRLCATKPRSGWPSGPWLAHHSGKAAYRRSMMSSITGGMVLSRTRELPRSGLISIVNLSSSFRTGLRLVNFTVILIFSPGSSKASPSPLPT